MSAPPSPRIGFTGKHASVHKKKGHVVGLAIMEDGRQAISDGEVRYTRESADPQDKSLEQHSFNLNVSAPEEPQVEEEHVTSRSTSSTSSLDPYYFGLQSESDEPPLPTPLETQYLSTTPEYSLPNEPVTPARNPASIDRRGLVGVGELATPRWARDDRDEEREDPPELPSDGDVEGYDVVVPEDIEEDQPDSPWTIEAVDGELSEKEEVPEVPFQSRPLRTQRSIADESGGEEILYPRNLGIASSAQAPSVPETPKVPRLPNRAPVPELSPPSAFNSSTRKARKRSSGEFELDQTGSMSPKYGGQASNKDKDDKTDARKHRSLGITVPSTKSDGKPRERRRESTGIGMGTKPSSFASKPGERHTRQSSASAASPSVTESHLQRRVHTTDFSHLPPSPSSTSIQQFLTHTPNAPSVQLASLQRSSKDNLRMHSSPNVAHSLLRGTQEGWSALDDDAAAEALRKLDGISGKSARARASVGSFGRPSSASRPATPSGKSGSQWEGLTSSDSGKSKRGSGGLKDNSSVKERTEVARSDNTDVPEVADASMTTNHEEVSFSIDKTPKKNAMPVRLSFTPKRGSTSSTTYASTPSSRDSASMSATTSATSMSAVSGGRHSSNKGRRNSASSDVSAQSSEAAHVKDRVASIAVNGDGTDEGNVPPVPPLPKDLSTYRSPPTTSSGLAFPTIPSDDRDKIPVSDSSSNKATPLDVPQYSSPIVSPPASARHDYYSSPSASDVTPPVLKTPSKKWSFSSALNLKLGSPSSAQKSSFPLSPRGVSFGQQLRKSTSKEQPLASSSTKGPWSPNQPDAMASAGSLASLSSVGSVKTPALTTNTAKTPDRAHHVSRPGTAGSSASNNFTSSNLAAPMPGPLSPTSSVRRGASKRLTPSSIPFFRRSSSQSMQVPPLGGAIATSPNSSSNMLSAHPSRTKQSSSPTQDLSSISTSTPGHKKTSILGLLKSSSRKSLHSDAKDAAKEMQKAKEAARESEKERAKLEKEKQKKEAKDRSESRISVIMNRKRGKTLSSTDPRKPKSPVNLPPMQMTALEPVTAQRVAKLKSSTNAALSSSTSARTSTSSSSSRLTNQTVSSLQKQSDASLRSRNQLPTIAGSPSVGTTGSSSSQTLKDNRDLSASLLNSTSGLPKETPTKIPRISSRTSAAPSPPGKNTTSGLPARRTSALAVSTSTNPSPTSFTTNEFGVIDNDDGATPKMRQPSVRSSPSGGPTPRLPRHPSVNSATVSTSSLARKPNRDSVSFIGLRKTSTNSTASLATVGTGNESSSSHHRFSLLSSTKASNTSTAAQPASSANDSSSSHRFSILSPSKGLKLVTPKSTTKAAASGNSQSTRPNMNSPSSSRQSLSTPSPAPSTVDEEELLGDEEMMHYIRRQHAKKLASGATQAELDELLKFPEPTAPTVPLSPSAILKGPQAQALSEYERKEVLDYPSVYYYGADSRKKLAVLDNPTNNYGYDDERGDYLIINHDHLAYRYEIIDSLGKGSFGQVLNCRDHSTGEMVAVKIIRNKKRFHHQALVEIKILDNLRKWDSEEKHHVIKMTEHFYFRNHLCIAMELLSINLYELIKANGFVGFTTALIRRFTSQMLLSLSLMRHHRIVHCDLKPENVLLRHPSKSGIKVIDFGSSCFDHEKIYTYIQSRFYRSPEVILGMNYHMAIDMWSLGCILAELYTGFPIFPGENEQEQLSCIMEVLGVPDKEFVNRSSRKKLFFDQHGAPRTVINSKGRRRRPGTKTLAQVLRCNDEEFVDFIAKCLVWDPERRMKPQAALRHPFIASGRRSRPPGIAPKSIPTSSTLGPRSKQVTETPKKSLISAPTPLTARSSRTNGGPTTPSNAHTQPPAPGSTQTSRSYRASQSQSLASYGSNRTLSGYASTSNK